MGYEIELEKLNTLQEIETTLKKLVVLKMFENRMITFDEAHKLLNFRV